MRPNSQEQFCSGELLTIMIPSAGSHHVVQTRSDLHVTHLGVASQVGVPQHKRVCKKRSGSFHLRHCNNYLFVATWNVRSLEKCVGDTKIRGVTKSVTSHPDFPVD